MTRRPLLHRLRRRFQRRLVRPITRGVVEPLRRWRNAERHYRPIFVAGTMGSGTTLMALSLAQRFQCAGFVAESGHQIAAASRLRVRLPSDFASVAAYCESLLPQPDWSVPASRQELQQLYRGNATGPANTMIDKGPNINLVRAGFLHECFPESWFVLVFRDPVANVEGFRRKWAPFSEEDLESSIFFYEETHRRFLDVTKTFRERVIGVSYERLVEHHEETLAAVAGRIGLEPAHSARRLEPRANVPGQGVRNVNRNRIGLVPDANQRAYDAMSEQEIESITTRLDPLYRLLEEETGLP